MQLVFRGSTPEAHPRHQTLPGAFGSRPAPTLHHGRLRMTSVHSNDLLLRVEAPWLEATVRKFLLQHNRRRHHRGKCIGSFGFGASDLARCTLGVDSEDLGCNMPSSTNGPPAHRNAAQAFPTCADSSKRPKSARKRDFMQFSKRSLLASR